MLINLMHCGFCKCTYDPRNGNLWVEKKTIKNDHLRNERKESVTIMLIFTNKQKCQLL